MADIVDTLILGPVELTTITDRYPGCEVLRLTDSDHSIQQYRLVIPDAEEDAYFDFLMDNWLAMSSHSFYRRFKSNKQFAARMKARIAED